MGVGRPLIREALRGLEAIGLIETRKGVGRFVRAFEVESYLGHFTSDFLVRSFSEKDLAETRCLLEIAAVSGAVEQLTDEDCVQIQDNLEDMRASFEEGVVDTEADLGMHRVIMTRADNTIIAALLDAVYSLTIAGGTMRERSASGASRICASMKRLRKLRSGVMARRPGRHLSRISKRHRHGSVFGRSGAMSMGRSNS